MYSCLGSGNCSNTVIDLCLAELHNVRDSVAPQSYVDSRSQAFSDSWAWLQGYACDICPLQAVSVLGSRDPACPGDHAARQRSVHSSALARDTVTWWKSRRPLRGAGAVSNRKSARYVIIIVPRLHLPNLWRWSLGG